MIPKIIHRITPEHPTEIHEMCWQSVKNHHGDDWQLITHTAPENTTEGWEITRDYWSKCKAPAFMCDLMRLEVLWNYGGIYLDSDVLIFKNLEPLLGDKPFVGLEDGVWLCNAVMGFPPKHPALMALIEETKRVLDSGKVAHPPIVTTDVLAPRDDINFLGQDEFYKYGPPLREVIFDLLGNIKDLPNIYGAHLWQASWFENGHVPEYLMEYSNILMKGKMISPFVETRKKAKVKENYGVSDWFGQDDDKPRMFQVIYSFDIDKK